VFEKNGKTLSYQLTLDTTTSEDDKTWDNRCTAGVTGSFQCLRVKWECVVASCMTFVIWQLWKCNRLMWQGPYV